MEYDLLLNEKFDFRVLIDKIHSLQVHHVETVVYRHLITFYFEHICKENSYACTENT
jgi:hypothetical protein